MTIDGRNHTCLNVCSYGEGEREKEAGTDNKKRMLTTEQKIKQ